METIRQRPQDPDLGDPAPLLIASQFSHLEVARLLLDAKADKDKAKNDGATPLFIAAQTGHLELAWRHPIVHAQNGNLEVARLLLDAKPDKDKARNDGATPLRIAAPNGNLQVARLVLIPMRTRTRPRIVAPPH